MAALMSLTSTSALSASSLSRGAFFGDKLTGRNTSPVAPAIKPLPATAPRAFQQAGWGRQQQGGWGRQRGGCNPYSRFGPQGGVVVIPIPVPYMGRGPYQWPKQDWNNRQPDCEKKQPECGPQQQRQKGWGGAQQQWGGGQQYRNRRWGEGSEGPSTIPPYKPKEVKYPQSDTSVVVLKNEENGAEIHLIGTAHISQASADEVRDIIQREKPDSVFVELDRGRYNRMFSTRTEETFLQQMLKALSGGDAGPVGKLIGVGLMGFYRLLAYRGFFPGQEFKVAIEEARKAGATVVLGDQDVNETLKRLEQSMSMWEVQNFFAQPMPPEVAAELGKELGGMGMGPMMGGGGQAFVEKLKNRKTVRRLNQFMEENAPALARVMLDERNEKMTRALRKLEGKVVAVVGMAHVDGMEQLWQEANDRYLKQKAPEPEQAADVADDDFKVVDGDFSDDDAKSEGNGGTKVDEPPL